MSRFSMLGTPVNGLIDIPCYKKKNTLSIHINLETFLYSLLC